MTPAEEALFWHHYGEYMRATDQRHGQAMMNALARVSMDLYSIISGTEADCFYQDSKIPAFKEAIGV